MHPRHQRDAGVVAAMLCAAIVSAQFVGGKAVRDALFLARLDLLTLPTMVIATSVFSIGLAAMNSRMAARLSPASLVRGAFAVSTILFTVEWTLANSVPKFAAVLIYLHVSGLGPILGSGFWLVASERFDPRTAKLRFGQIAGAGTLGGLFGGLVAERVATVFGTVAVLLFLAVLSGLSAWQLGRIVATSIEPSPGRAPESPKSGLRVLAGAPYLRYLAMVVLLGTISATLVDYVFKGEAVRHFGRGEGLLRFFAIYYAATGLVTFAVQALSSGFLLQRFGLAFTTGTPSIGLIAGSIAALVKPGLGSVVATRGAESIFRGSLFRAGYELFYTPMAPAEKRAAKSIIDVGCDRLGDGVGGGLVQFVLLLAPAAQYSVLLSLGLGCSTLAVLLASRLNRGYVHTLEESLANRAVELDPADIQDVTTRTTMLRTLESSGTSLAPVEPSQEVGSAAGVTVPLDTLDPEVRDIRRLRSRDRGEVLKVLRGEPELTSALVPHVIPLLIWAPVAHDAALALAKVAEARVGALIDALTDPNHDPSVRRRLARVFSACDSQRAVDGLMLGLDDPRFEVRFQCGASLSAIHGRNSRIRIDQDRVLEVVLREATVSRPVWERRRLLDAHGGTGESASLEDEAVRSRGGRSLGHVFTLLSLVLPRGPIQLAYRALRTENQNLHGTALEYLETVLPGPVRERLWPFLDDRQAPARPVGPKDEVLADLLRSSESIMMNFRDQNAKAPRPVRKDD